MLLSCQVLAAIAPTQTISTMLSTPLTTTYPTSTPPTTEDVINATKIQMINSTNVFQNTYHPGISKSKAAIIKGLNKAPVNIRAIVMAMGMQECATMDARTDPKPQNYGLFNLNSFAIALVRPWFKKSDYNKLNDFSTKNTMLSSTSTLSGIIQDGLSKDITSFLDAVRGGSTAYYTADKWDCKYQCLEYRNNIASIAYMILEDPNYLSDDRRIDAVTSKQ